MKENKGKGFLILIIVLVILGLQPGVRNGVIQFFSRHDIFSQFGIDEKKQEEIKDPIKNNIEDTLQPQK
ncbi:hypothetical protein VNN41_09865 [Lactococcus garvieae]|uniref:hypothetical protein n=1 Tax=Lactococcus garvieae TaxID=1363 RepID=UPI003246B686